MHRKRNGRRRDSLQNRERVPSRCLEMISVDGQVNINVRHAKIDRSLQFIARNYRAPIKLAKLVEISQMSRRGFLKAFQRHTGTSPVQLLRQIRIEQSKRILIENDLKLTEIAAMSGFGQLNSFCVAFKQVTGVAPKQFQRQAWLESYKSRRDGAVRKWETPRSRGLKRPILSKN